MKAKLERTADSQKRQYTSNECIRAQLISASQRALNEAPRCHYQRHLMLNRLGGFGGDE